VCISWTHKEFDINNALCNHEDELTILTNTCKNNRKYYFGSLFMKIESMTENVTECIGQISQNAFSKYRNGMSSLNVLFSEIFFYHSKFVPNEYVLITVSYGIVASFE
jgi:hypothetical protein